MKWSLNATMLQIGVYIFYHISFKMVDQLLCGNKNTKWQRTKIHKILNYLVKTHHISSDNDTQNWTFFRTLCMTLVMDETHIYNRQLHIVVAAAKAWNINQQYFRNVSESTEKEWRARASVYVCEWDRGKKRDTKLDINLRIKFPQLCQFN